MGIFSFLFGKKDPGAQRPSPSPAPSTPVDDEDEFEGGGAVPQELAEPEARALFQKPARPVFLDVREPPELEASGWIPGAVQIPCSQLEERLTELDPKSPVIVYCAGGGRSMDAGCFLLEHGFRDVSNLNGGFTSWQGPKETKSP